MSLGAKCSATHIFSENQNESCTNQDARLVNGTQKLGETIPNLKHCCSTF